MSTINIVCGWGGDVHFRPEYKQVGGRGSRLVCSWDCQAYRKCRISQIAKISTCSRNVFIGEKFLFLSSCGNYCIAIFSYLKHCMLVRRTWQLPAHLGKLGEGVALIVYPSNDFFLKTWSKYKNVGGGVCISGQTTRQNISILWGGVGLHMRWPNLLEIQDLQRLPRLNTCSMNVVIGKIKLFLSSPVLVIMP